MKSLKFTNVFIKFYIGLTLLKGNKIEAALK